MIGTTDDQFSPNTSLSRAMIVTILYRHGGEPSIAGLDNPFSDVASNAWYTDAVKWAVKEGIVTGYGDGTFGPNDPVTKEQLAALVYRTQLSSGTTLPNVPANSKAYTDLDTVSNWAKDPVNALNAQGIFQDLPGNSFNPQTPATRAEVASMLKELGMGN
jgi:hypothetical protein